MSRERQHPAEVTAMRLLKHYEDWWERFTPAEREAIGAVRTALHEIADGER